MDADPEEPVRVAGLDLDGFVVDDLELAAGVAKGPALDRLDREDDLTFQLVEDLDRISAARDFGRPDLGERRLALLFCPPKAKVTRSNRVGCANVFNALRHDWPLSSSC